MAHALSHNASIQAICDKNSRLWHILRAATGVSCQRNAGNVPQASMLVRPAQRTCLGVHLRRARTAYAAPSAHLRRPAHHIASKQQGHPKAAPRQRRYIVLPAIDYPTPYQAMPSSCQPIEIRISRSPTSVE